MTKRSEKRAFKPKVINIELTELTDLLTEFVNKWQKLYICISLKRGFERVQKWEYIGV